MIWIFLYKANQLNDWFLGSFSVWFSEKGKTVTGCFTTLKYPSSHPGSTSSAVRTSPPSQTIRPLNSFHYGFWIVLNTDVVRCFILWKHSLLLEEALMEVWSGLITLTLLTFTMQVCCWQSCALEAGKFTDLHQPATSKYKSCWTKVGKFWHWFLRYS